MGLYRSLPAVDLEDEHQLDELVKTTKAYWTLIHTSILINRNILKQLGVTKLWFASSIQHYNSALHSFPTVKAKQKIRNFQPYWNFSAKKAVKVSSFASGISFFSEFWKDFEAARRMKKYYPINVWKITKMERKIKYRRSQ